MVHETVISNRERFGDSGTYPLLNFLSLIIKALSLLPAFLVLDENNDDQPGTQPPQISLQSGEGIPGVLASHRYGGYHRGGCFS